MVSLKVDAMARIEGSEDERYPIVAKVKGSGKEGALGVQISGDGSAPLTARISGDIENPVAVSPITVVPDLREAVKVLDFQSVVGSLAKISEGFKVEVSTGSKGAVSVKLGKIPVDLTISVRSPAKEEVFQVEIKGSVGENQG
jgi:hypothetical protein